MTVGDLILRLARLPREATVMVTGDELVDDFDVVDVVLDDCDEDTRCKYVGRAIPADMERDSRFQVGQHHRDLEAAG